MKETKKEDRMNAMMLKVYRIRPDRSVEENGKGRVQKRNGNKKEKRTKRKISTGKQSVLQTGLQ